MGLAQESSGTTFLLQFIISKQRGFEVPAFVKAQSVLAFGQRDWHNGKKDKEGENNYQPSKKFWDTKKSEKTH
ncbi:MAG: hypothetical protein ABIH04_04150 [Planctomycetota bacterium]